MNALPPNEPPSRLIRDGIRVPVLRPVSTDLGVGACSQAGFIIPMSLQSQTPEAAAIVTFTATFMAR